MLLNYGWTSVLCFSHTHVTTIFLKSSFLASFLMFIVRTHTNHKRHCLFMRALAHGRAAKRERAHARVFWAYAFRARNGNEILLLSRYHTQFEYAHIGVSVRFWQDCWFQQACSVSCSEMASSHLKSPVFLSLTFYGQNQVRNRSATVSMVATIRLFSVCQLVVNTNGNGHLIHDALSLVCEALGPFR